MIKKILLIFCLFFLVSCDYKENNYYEVNFFDGSTIISSIEVLENDELQYPNTFKEGYKFINWYTEKECINIYNDEEVNNDFTLYGKWEKLKYTVSFTTNCQKEIEDKKIEYDSILEIPNLINEGYTLSGWYLDKEFKNIYNFDNTIIADITLFAKWIKNDEYVTIFFMDNDEQIDSIEIIKGTKTISKELERKDFTLQGWAIDSIEGIVFDFNNPVNNDLILYAVWKENPLTISFNTFGGSIVESVMIEKKSTFPIVQIPQKEYYLFSGWYYDEDCLNEVDIDKKIYEDLIVYALWEKDPNFFYEITFDLGDNCWNNKDEFRKSFYGDFYQFLKENTDVDFESLEIKSFDDFDAFCMNWYVRGRSDLYGVGDAFGRYFVTRDTDGLLENQPTTTFIGYCYQNGKYLDFLPFLMNFFAYWRTDEGYTTEDNHGNDFFDSPWASMVDTAKFFFFTSSTLNDKYAWFNSIRVKDALDNIPNVLKRESKVVMFIEDEYILPQDIERNGYIFMGWYDSEEYSNEVFIVEEQKTIYALWKRE